MTAIHLTAAKVFAAARLAYDENRLSAQGPTPECRYRDASGRPCAVGAAMTDKEAALLLIYNRTSVAGLPNKLVTVELGDYDRISSLQEAHDEWARGGTPASFIRQLLSEDHES